MGRCFSSKFVARCYLPVRSRLRRSDEVESRKLQGTIALRVLLTQTLALLERAFESHLLFYIPPLLEAAFKNLDAIYPYYYQALGSGALPPQLTRYITDIFGIVQTILRAPQFDGLPLQHVYSSLFFHSVKFAQLSDETVTQWLEDPYYILEESADSIATTAVRAVVLHCALEVPASDVSC